MSNNKQALELTDITAPFLPATQGFTMEDCGASTTNEINDDDLDSAERGENRRNSFATRSTSTPISDETMCFLLDSAKRGQNLGKQCPPSICKVPRILRDLSESSFNPQLVSIGPIHREDPKLKEFEWQKECYLDDLLNRCDGSTPKEILEACLLKVNTLLPKIKASYGGAIKNYSDDELARMMVMDGCFILEFCFKHEEEDEHLPNKTQTRRIAIDMILLENQVPFLVLQALFNCLAPHVVTTEGSVTLSRVLDAYLAPYVNKLFRFRLPENISTTDVDSNSTHDHLLGYLHKRFNDHSKSSKPTDAEEDEERISFESIVELNRFGMNFKRHHEDERSMTIKFQSYHFACLPGVWKPTLLMPTLVIGDFTELILRNFIAYEKSFLTDHNYFTSYANAMDMLINTQEDIAKLVESRVLLNALGSNQEAADMINKLCKNTTVTDFYYTAEFKQVRKYCNRVWPKHIAFLRRVYFSNPWSTMALLAAMILFGLTVVQTIFTIKGK